MLRIAECLSRGELVGMLGDRSAGSEKTVTCRFFGRDADLPQGPLRLALGLRVPVYWVAGLYEGGKRYVIHLEPFCEEPNAERAGRAAWAREWTQRYAERLDHFCRLAPYNWFNFYDFWGKSPRQDRPRGLHALASRPGPGGTLGLRPPGGRARAGADPPAAGCRGRARRPPAEAPAPPRRRVLRR